MIGLVENRSVFINQTMSLKKNYPISTVIASPHYLATEVGINTIRQGGNIFDAAVAVALAVSVVQPYHSGLGGGCTVTLRTAEGKYSVIQSRGKSHQKAMLETYLMYPTKQGIHLMIVPGLIAGITMLHSRYGSLDWSLLCESAIQLALLGFTADPQMSRITIPRNLINIHDFPISLQPPIRFGERISQPHLAATLAEISKDPNTLYQGRIGKTICDFVRTQVGLDYCEDFAEFRVFEHIPLTTTYRGWKMVFPALPHIGAIQVMLVLHILEKIDFSGIPFMSLQYYHILAEAIKLSFVERAKLQSEQNALNLLSLQKAEECWNNIRADQVVPFNRQIFPSDQDGGTSHISLADNNGNMIALTQTIGRNYGCGWIEPKSGIILNDLIGDFSMSAQKANPNGIWNGSFNTLRPSATPASSQSPMIAISPDNKQILALGAAGGPKIVSAVAQALVNRIDYRLDIAECMCAPRIHTHGTNLFMEDGIPKKVVIQLAEIGHRIKRVDFLSQVQIVCLHENILDGAADPRGVGSVNFIGKHK